MQKRERARARGNEKGREKSPSFDVITFGRLNFHIENCIPKQQNVNRFSQKTMNELPYGDMDQAQMQYCFHLDQKQKCICIKSVWHFICHCVYVCLRLSGEWCPGTKYCILFDKLLLIQPIHLK